MITHAELKSIVIYDPVTGIFTWSKRVSQATRIGQVAGSKKKSGYVELQIKGLSYMAHRLAWLYVTGHWPKHEIDHIDSSRSNNAIVNLRDVTHSVNMQNQKVAPSSSNTGILGASKFGNRYRSRINVCGENVNLGTFSTAEDAGAAYLKAKQVKHAGCAS